MMNRGLKVLKKNKNFIHYIMITQNDNSYTLVHVYRLDNNDNRVLWSIECTFVQENGEKYITVSLNCDLQEYNSRLPP